MINQFSYSITIQYNKMQYETIPFNTLHYYSIDFQRNWLLARIIKVIFGSAKRTDVPFYWTCPCSNCLGFIQPVIFLRPLLYLYHVFTFADSTRCNVSFAGYNCFPKISDLPYVKYYFFNSKRSDFYCIYKYICVIVLYSKHRLSHNPQKMN